MKQVIIVHGGAGNWKSKDIRQANSILEESANSGLSLLKQGKSSIDAVQHAIVLLENSGFFNAGRGSCRQEDGKIRMDASIMTGHNLNCGAVAAVENISNPIMAARLVMETTDHVLLVSSFATEFARTHQLDELPADTPGGRRQEETVGAVAIDRTGMITAGTSTGGLSRGMLPGRVGDSAIPGCGTYANEYCGVSTTGLGEAIVKSVLARRACEYVEQGLAPQEAAEKSLHYLAEKTGGEAGLIMVDRDGRFGISFNTRNMLWYRKT